MRSAVYTAPASCMTSRLFQTTTDCGSVTKNFSINPVLFIIVNRWYYKNFTARYFGLISVIASILSYIVSYEAFVVELGFNSRHNTQINNM